jgi:hypothetical protein
MGTFNISFHGSNVIHFIILDWSLTPNRALVRSVTNFLWSWSIDDALHLQWVLEINRRIVINCKKPPIN